MSAVFAWPAELKRESQGLALTFVLPARACNLRCGFCAIAQRSEAAHGALSARDYAYFLDDVADAHPLAIAAIQGYEPLLPEAWPHTVALIRAARERSVPIGMVTNGILLAQRARDLAELRPTGITVSLDSAQPEEHDRLRGRRGAFARTVAGLQSLLRHPQFESTITVSSVLMPRGQWRLTEMPALLSRLGVRHWSVNPLLAIRADGRGGSVAPGAEIIGALMELNQAAQRYQVRLVLDDELKQLDVDFAELTVRQFDRPDGLLRLSPTGACSVGRDILRPVGLDTPIWRPPEIQPRNFVQSVLPTPA